MVFPQTPLPFKAELLLGSTWTDITAYVRARDSIQITRGQRAENTLTDPSILTLTLGNRDGRFSPRNPVGAYYGTIGRNTPLRLSITGSSTRLLKLDGFGALTPDSAGLSIVGDIDLRFDGDMGDWTANVGVFGPVEKWGGVQKSYFLSVTILGTIVIKWSTTGADELSAESTVPLPRVYGRQAIRATLDVNNGAAGRTATFYTADTMAGTWVQLGDPVVQAGTTSIFNGTSPVQTQPFGGDVYAVKILQGIAGTERGNPDFTIQTSGATSFADAAGNTWTIDAPYSELTNRRDRFYGEVSSWPQQWDPSDQDAWVPIEAAGVLRRLGQGQSPLKSTLRHAIPYLPSLVAYWPAEDAAGATSIGSAVGGPPMTLIGSPTFATADDFAASSPLPQVRNSQWRGRVPLYASTGDIQVRFLMLVPAGGTTNGAIIVRVHSSGSVKTWDLAYSTGGALTLKAYDAGAVEVVNSGPVSFAVDGKLLRVSLEFTQDAADIDWRFAVLEVGGGVGAYTSGTKTFATANRATGVDVDVTGNMDDVAIGHISVESASSSIFIQQDQLNAYVGEVASTRIVRLCDQEGMPSRIVGGLLSSAPMGAQRPATLLELLRECEATDGGILYEPRDQLGLVYRQRDALYNRPVAVALDYDGEDLSALEPVDDDQQTRNDVTVSRVAGSSARAVLDSGPLSVQSPPNGVGRYDTAVTINPESDGVLTDHAYWRLHLGTVDESRYPQIGVQLARPVFTAADRDTVMDFDVGGAATVTDLPAWLPPDDIIQGAVGFRELLDTFSHYVTVVCVPASPYEVGAYDTDDARYHPAVASTLGSSATTSATSLSVATASGPLWTTAAGDRPFDILVGGERMTVTGLSGASSPQTFTVTRSVNGVVKTHAAGAGVDLFVPTVYAL